MPIPKTLAEIGQVAAVNSTALALTFTELEAGLKILLLLVSIVFTIDKWVAHRKEIKKNNVAVCTNQGWDEMYVLPGGEKLDISDDDMSEIVPGVAKKGDLKKAFSKMTSGRKNSRPLLNKFIGMIA